MGKRGKKRAEPELADVKEEPGLEAVKEEPQEDDGLTELERQRAEIIRRNRERLMALGIPSLKAQLDKQGGGEQQQKKKVKKEAGEFKPRVKHEPGAPEAPTRRSSRLLDAVEHPKPKPETAEERQQRELGLFAVEGACPRCGKELERPASQRAHLAACGGPRPPRQPRAADADELEDLTEEQRADQYQRTLARMKKVHLDGLIGFTDAAATFAVFSSQGDKTYTVTLADEKHKCTCLDHRFRRHNCKHVLAVLDSLGTLEAPEKWRPAVEARLDQLLSDSSQRHAGETVAAAPPNKQAAVALKFV